DVARPPLPFGAGAPGRADPGAPARPERDASLRQRLSGAAAAPISYNADFLQPLNRPLNLQFLRFSDPCTQGRAKAQHLFIRADLIVPNDATGDRTEDSGARVSIPAIQMDLAAGEAVMITNDVGRPTQAEFELEDSLAPVAARLGELMDQPV